MQAKLIIPGRFPGMNEYTAAKNRHWAVGNRMKQENQQIAVFCILQQLHNVQFERPVSVWFVFYEPNRRRDEDNVTAFGKKVIFDALKECGVIKDDRKKCVKKQYSDVLYDKANPRIEVIISDEEA
jgi:Holliday junction resolvase RusA-like endonuclease